MKIAYLVNQYPKVSHSFIRREILELEQQGFEVQRIAVRGWDAELMDPADQTEKTKTIYVLQSGILPVAFATLRTFLLTPIKAMRAMLAAVRLARGSRRPLFTHLAYVAEACWILPRLKAAESSHVHAHFGTNPSEIALQIFLLGGPSYSLTIHGSTEFDSPKALHLCEKIHHARFVIAISHFCSSQLRRWACHDDWQKIHVVRCGIDRDFYEGQDSPPTNESRLVCIGRLCEQKGHLLLLEAAVRLKEQGFHFKLVLAGDGELRKQIEQQIEILRLSDYVSITGYIDAAGVRREILAARALVLPSFAEGLPVVIMESMFLKRPALATYVAGIPELIINGENGWLVPAGDLEGLVAGLKEVLAAPVDTLLAMGSAARIRAEGMHSISQEVTKLANLFRETVG